MYHEEVYKGYSIKVFNDEDGWRLNPYEDGDGMYPMMVDGGYRGCDHDYNDASRAFYPRSTAHYRRHKKALLEQLEIDEQFERKDSIRGLDASDIEQMVDEAIDEAVKEKNFDLLQAIGHILGVPCLHTSSNGYSQGDHLEMLVVWTEKWGDELGVTKKQALADKEGMETNAKIFAAWAWGDIFGFEITDPDSQEFDDNSCWGFIEPETYPTEKMYVVQEARDSVDAEIAWREKKEAERIAKCKLDHAVQLKIWIRNRVPFNYRQPLSL